MHKVHLLAAEYYTRANVPAYSGRHTELLRLILDSFSNEFQQLREAEARAAHAVPLSKPLEKPQPIRDDVAVHAAFLCTFLPTPFVAAVQQGKAGLVDHTRAVKVKAWQDRSHYHLLPLIQLATGLMEATLLLKHHVKLEFASSVVQCGVYHSSRKKLYNMLTVLVTNVLFGLQRALLCEEQQQGRGEVEAVEGAELEEIWRSEFTTVVSVRDRPCWGLESPSRPTDPDQRYRPCVARRPEKCS